MYDPAPIARVLMWLATVAFLISAAWLVWEGKVAEGLAVFGAFLISLAIDVVN